MKRKQEEIEAMEARISSLEKKNTQLQTVIALLTEKVYAGGDDTMVNQVIDKHLHWEQLYRGNTGIHGDYRIIETNAIKALRDTWPFTLELCKQLVAKRIPVWEKANPHPQLNNHRSTCFMPYIRSVDWSHEHKLDTDGEKFNGLRVRLSCGHHRLIDRREYEDTPAWEKGLINVYVECTDKSDPYQVSVIHETSSGRVPILVDLK
jgi:hypothetical protein